MFSGMRFFLPSRCAIPACVIIGIFLLESFTLTNRLIRERDDNTKNAPNRFANGSNIGDDIVSGFIGDIDRIPPKKITCYTRNPAWHGHFPHHFEKIVQCWHHVYQSYRSSHHLHLDTSGTLEFDIGGALDEVPVTYAFGRRPLSPYGKEIMRLLNFQPHFTKVTPVANNKFDIEEFTDGKNNTSSVFKSTKVKEEVHIIPDGLAENGFKWFHSVEEASAFRKRVLPSVESPFHIFFDDIAGNGGKNYDEGRANSIPKIRIGFIQRKESRVIDNMEEIQSFAKQNLKEMVDAAWRFETATTPISTSIPEYEIQIEPPVYLEDLSIHGVSEGISQTSFFATHHIIFTPHGAGTINAAFLHPGCVVVEVFPKNYALIYYFRGLVQQAGGLYLYWYEGSSVEGQSLKNVSADGQDIMIDHTNERQDDIRFVQGIHNISKARLKNLRKNGMVEDTYWKQDFDLHAGEFMELKNANMTPPVGEVSNLLMEGVRHVLEVGWQRNVLLDKK